jgi:tetratricopeptide (TPR) repeat protein
LQKLGLAYFRLGNLPAAREATLEALRLKSDALDARQQLVEILLAWGDALTKKGQTGVVEYQTALSNCMTVMSQTNAPLWFFVRASMAYARLNRWDEAEQAVRTAYNPGFADARVQLVEILLAKGDRLAASGRPAADVFKEAYDIAAETVKNAPPVVYLPRLQLAKLLLRLGHLDDAEIEARQIKDPNLASEVEQLLAAIQKARSPAAAAPHPVPPVR